MDEHRAQSILKLAEGYDEEAIHQSYAKAVRLIAGSNDFEARLKELNIARDVLRGGLARRAAISLVADTHEPAPLGYVEQQRNLSLASARVSRSFELSQKSRLEPIKIRRDFAALFGALSAGFTYFSENVAKAIFELTPRDIGDAGIVPSETVLGAFFVIMSAIMGILAYFEHRRIEFIRIQIQELDAMLTRRRYVERLLGRVFDEESRLQEDEFEWRLEIHIELLLGSGSSFRKIGLKKLISRFLLSAAAIDRNQIRKFIDDYIDFLVASGFVGTEGVSGRDLEYLRLAPFARPDAS